MPDPHVLYVVTAVVVLGLVAWVVAVLVRAPPASSWTRSRSPGEPKPGAPAGGDRVGGDPPRGPELGG